MTRTQSTPQFELYFSARSPFARRIRVALANLRVPFEGKEISVFEPPADFLKISPLGLVPVLVVKQTDQETLVIPDSSAILEYLNEPGNLPSPQGDSTFGIWPNNTDKPWARAASTLAAGVMQHTVNHFLESLKKAPDTETTNEASERIVATLTNLNELLKGKQHLFINRSKATTQTGFDLVIALDYLSLRIPALDWNTQFSEFQNLVTLAYSNQAMQSTRPPKT